MDIRQITASARSLFGLRRATRPASPDGGVPLAREQQRRALWPLAVAAIVAVCLFPALGLAQSPRDLFTSAQARERQARSAMVAPRTTSASALRAIRAAVAAYEKAAAEIPGGVYADAALWSAAELAGDGFGAFGEERDRKAALRLARAILRDHPASAYRAKATDHITRLATLRVGDSVSVLGIQQRLVSDGTELVIDLDGGVWFRAVRLDDPPRLYFDLYNTRTPDALRGAVLSFPTGAVAQLRVGHHPHQTTRVVLEGDDVHGCAATLADAPARLIVFCRTTTVAPPPHPAMPEPRAFPSLIPLPPTLVSTIGPATSPVAYVPAVADPLDVSPQLSGVEHAPREGPSRVAAPQTDAALEPPVLSRHEPPPEAASARGGLPSRAFTAHLGLAPAVPARRLALPRVADPAGPRGPMPLLFAEPTSGTLAASRPTVRIAAAAQILHGDEVRLGTLADVQPDLGVQLAIPGTRIGAVYADANVTTRAGHPVLGRGLLRLNGIQTAGLTWSLSAGDALAAPVTPDFGFANLFAPPVNLRGISLNGRSDRTSVTASAARLMVRRNMFGTDTLPTGQQLVQVAVSHRPDRFLEVFGRASSVRGNSPFGYTALVDASSETGGGVRFRPTSSWELIADGGYSTFRRTGSNLTERDVSALLGATWTGTAGWFQVNASRRALGHYAVGNYPYNDRSSVFATGEWGPWERFRLYGGADVARTGLDPSAADRATVSLPAGTSTRGFGGFRLQFGSWSAFGVRIDGGGRDIYPSKFGGGFASDTGALSADWNVRLRGANAVVRYERRSNVDAGIEGSDFTQHDGSAQLFVSLGGSQVFLQGLLSQRIDRDGSGQTLWQASGGSQVPLGRVFVRFEGALGHTRDWATQRVVRRESLSASATGRITNQTQFSVDVYLDHTPVEFQAVSPWMVRTMFRVTQSLAFGAIRTGRASGAAPYRGPTGKVTGVVFADWNGNGVADLDEDPIPGVRVVAGPSIATGNDDGRFTLESVPTGNQRVALDLASVPAAYDPPSEPQQTVSVASKGLARIDFGLVPLGSVHGIVYQDVDGDGVLSGPDASIDLAVVVLDDGERTEVTRDGRFWFDNVRIGPHTVSVLLPSLPEGAQLAGPATIEIALSREEPTSQVTFVVTMEKRQEIRKVFAPKKKG